MPEGRIPRVAAWPALADAGATHLQLVLDSISAETVDTIGATLADLDR
jgi:hypothetical protein